MEIRIVILNYNGAELLRECLPSVIQAARVSSHTVGVSVIDNQSTDPSREVVEKEFPEVKLWPAPRNRVLCSYNDYLLGVNERVVILLNNDIRVAEDFVDPLAAHFEHEGNVFMVTPKCLSFDGSRYEGGRSQSRIRFGLFWHSCTYKGYQQGIDSPSFTMAAGFGAFDRIKFLELGGYDDLYLPGRLEDNDLCFRAWKRGWPSYYEPRSVVYHKGAASFNKRFGEKKTVVLAHRNSFLFVWKNITDFRYLAEHLLLLVPRLAYSLLAGKRELVEGFVQALPHLPTAIQKRKVARREKAVLSDREVFAKVKTK